MPANIIVFDAEYTRQQVNNLNNAKRILEESISILKKANAHRSWRCPEVSRINDNLDSINKRLGRLNNGMSDTIRVLNIGVQRFQELESRAENQVNNLSVNLKEKHGVSASTYGSQGEKANLPVTPVPYDESSIAITKAGLSWLDKAELSNKAGLGKEGLSYLESLYKMCNFLATGDKRGLTGAENLCDLTDKSIGLWKELYDYYKGKNDLSGLFSIVNQKKVEGLGIVGDSFGLVSDTLGVINKINSENIGTAGIIGEVIELGENGIDIWSDVENLKHLGDAATNITTRAGVTGLYSPLTFYTAAGKGVVSTVAQGFKSVEKYSADGVWDLRDTGQTLIDSGMSGLWAIGDVLSFGGLSAIGKATGISAESLAEGLGNLSRDLGVQLRNFGQDLGKQAGNYILNDPGLLNAYNNVGPIGKTAITFHAAFQSGVQSVAEGIGNWFQSLWG